MLWSMGSQSVGHNLVGLNNKRAIGIDTYILPCIKQITSVLYSVICGGLNGKEIQKRRNICIRIALLY